MNFGYLLFVSNNKDYDYIKMAYALAVSIKNTQKQGYNRVALVVDNPALIKRLKSPWVFDKVIVWDKEKFWDGRSWMDKMSPWDYTVCLDSDMLFTRDYSHWIDYFIKNCDLYVANKSYTYRNELVTSDFYRKTFTKNNLPNLYSFYTFFNKNSNLSKDFFELGRYIIKNPTEFSNLFLSEFKPKVVGTDEAFALSSKILGLDDIISYPLEFPKVVHMKPMVQNWPWPSEKWTDHLGFYLDTSGNIKIGNYLQDNMVHYVDKNLITDEYINILEEILWKN